MLPWGARTTAGGVTLVGVIPSETGGGDGDIGGMAGFSGAGKPPLGSDDMPGIGPRVGLGAGTGTGPGTGIGPGGPIGPPNAGDPGLGCASALPQLRQNLIPGGFSPWHTPHTETPGNLCHAGGVCPCARELPQFRQNDAPDGLSWPHFEQRIVPLTVNPIQVSQQLNLAGMGSGRFATP